MTWIVEGGIFKDTNWDEVVSESERYGPFDLYKEAHLVWMQKTFTQKLDNCMHRLFIKEI